MKRHTAIFISGRGSNMMSLVKAARARDYPAEIVCVISNRPEALGLVWAKAQGIPAIAVDHKAYKDKAAFEAALQEKIEAHGAELVALAGFMRLMSPAFVERWRNRMLNIHPSLLPSFKGLHTHERAIAAGVKIAGCTVHLVRAEMDNGPILAQAAVPVLEGDSAEALAARVLAAEHKLYPRVLELFASNRISVDGEKVVGFPIVNQEAVLFSPLL